MSTILMIAYTNYRRDPRVRREAEALASARHHVVFLACRQAGEAGRENLAGVDVVKLPGIAHRRTSASGYIVDYALFFALAMLHLLRHPLRYDLVHVNNMPDFLVFAAWLPRMLGRPVIHDVHDLMPELYCDKFGMRDGHWLVRLLRLQERSAGRFASAVLTVEDRLKEILSRRGIPAGKISVLMNLPDDRIFAHRSKPPCRLPGAPIVVVYHGTLAHRLGLDLALRALATLRRRGFAQPIEFRIIGAGEERSALIELRDELGLREEVRFTDGFVAVERIPALLEDADIGLVPLRASPGTDIMLPTKLLEYVLVGIPCIVSRTSTIARYFDDGTVRFVDAGDVDSLADAIAELAADAALRERIAAAATERFSARYRWSVHKRVYVDLVDRLLEPRRQGAAAPASHR